MNPSDEQRLDRWAARLDPETPADDAAELSTAELSSAELSTAERAGLDAVAARLKDEAIWSEPPAQLRARLLAQAAAEEQPLTRQPRTRWQLLAAAAAAVLLIAGGVTAALWPRDPAAITFALSGTALAPRAVAQAELRPRSAGVAIELEITGLGPAPAGTYYAAWLRGPDGVVPVGSFHWRKGGIPIDLWSGVSADRYPELFVTVQAEGAGPGPSDRVVMSGRAHS